MFTFVSPTAMKPMVKKKVMKKLIHITITGSHSQQFYPGEDAQKDFFEAIKKAAETLQAEQLHYATVCLFDDENDEHAVKKFEIMRH